MRLWSTINFLNVQPQHFGPPPPPSFLIPQQKFEPQDVRYQHPQRPHSKNQQHPPQHDPNIPKGPKSKTPDLHLPMGPRPNPPEWPALSQGQTRPKSSNSRKSSGGQRKQGAIKVFQNDLVLRPRSAPYQQPVQHLQHLQPTQHQQPIQHSQPIQHPIPQNAGHGGSLKAFIQVPSGFAAPTEKKMGMCSDENCDYC
jgi:hypothetical protein